MSNINVPTNVVLLPVETLRELVEHHQITAIADNLKLSYLTVRKYLYKSDIDMDNLRTTEYGVLLKLSQYFIDRSIVIYDGKPMLYKDAVSLENK